jgi:hypothetical protein
MWNWREFIGSPSFSSWLRGGGATNVLFWQQKIVNKRISCHLAKLVPCELRIIMVLDD